MEETSPYGAQTAPSGVVENSDYRTLVELAPDVIYRLDRQGRFTSLSPAFERITGWSSGEWIGRTFDGVVHPDDLPRAVENFQSTVRGNRRPAFELRVKTRTGDYVVGEFITMPEFSDGAIVGSIGVARDITDRKRAEEALLQVQEQLRQSRDQLAAVLSSVDDGITVQDARGQLIYANDTALRIMGFTSLEEVVTTAPGEILQRYDMIGLDGERLSPDALPGRRILQGEPPAEVEVCFRLRQTGEERWSMVSAMPICDGDGRVELVVNVFRDITDRRRAVDARMQLAAIVESSTDAIIGKNLDAIVTSWNSSAERLYGYREEEIVGRSIEILAPPDRPQEIDGIMERIRRGESIEHLDTVRITKDGRRLDVSVSVSPIRDAAGRITGASTIARDISEQKRLDAERGRLLLSEKEARRRAEEAQARLAFLAEASQILAESLDYETTLGNVARIAVPRLAEWCTIDVREEDGSIRRIALSHPDPEKVRFARELEQRYPPRVEETADPRSPWKTGKSIVLNDFPDELLRAAAQDEEHLHLLRGLGICSAMAVPLLVRDRVIGVILFVATESRRRFGDDDLALAEDLARRAAVAVDNARLYRQTQEALRLREEFLSIASHELKTPLTALQLQMQLLERKFARGPMQTPGGGEDRLVRGARRQLQRLARLINDLLDVSRLGLGRLEMERQDVDLGGLVTEVVDRFAEVRAASGSPVSVQLRESPVVMGDRFRLDQVVTNLLSNAIKYGQGKPIEIEVGATGSEGLIRVRDHGIGIAPEHLHRVFDRFERVTLPQSYGGLGLGLYIARQIVEAHGGAIRVESDPERYTTFTVRLPRGRRESESPG